MREHEHDVQNGANQSRGVKKPTLQHVIIFHRKTDEKKAKWIGEKERNKQINRQNKKQNE